MNTPKYLGHKLTSRVISAGYQLSNGDLISVSAYVDAIEPHFRISEVQVAHVFLSYSPGAWKGFSREVKAVQLAPSLLSAIILDLEKKIKAEGGRG